MQYVCALHYIQANAGCSIWELLRQQKRRKAACVMIMRHTYISNADILHPRIFHEMYPLSILSCNICKLRDMLCSAFDL